MPGNRRRAAVKGFRDVAKPSVDAEGKSAFVNPQFEVLDARYLKLDQLDAQSILNTHLISDLNSDLLDGLHGSSYLKLDQTTPQTVTGRLTLPSLAVDTNTIYVDATNHRVGIGTTTPAANIYVQGTLNQTQNLMTLGSTQGTTPYTFSINKYGQPVADAYGVNGNYFQLGGNLSMYNGFILRWGPNASFGSSDTGLSRLAIGKMGAGNGTAGDFTGTLIAGKLGIGVSSPTARLHLPAGAAGAGLAPLKLTSGTVQTTPEAGAIEFLTDDYFATITTGAARKALILDDGTRLTSGKIPVATTNGRLVDGPTPAADGTYALPTSITIAKGLITAIS